MKTNDVLLINSSVRHSVCADTKNILCRVAYDYQVLAELLRDGNGMFLCNSTVDQEKSYEKLQLLLRELVYEELLYSERNITKIAMECSFSNTSVFDKVFRENYGMSPSEYRVIMRAKVNDEQKQRESVREQMREELKEKIGIPKKTKAPDSKNIEINAQETHTLKKNWNQVINIGSAHSLTLANVQYHLLYLVEQLGFTYARIWSVFDKRLMICDGSSIGVYNYDALDSVLDFLVSHHIIPFLDLGRRPSTAVRSAGDAVYYREEGIEFKSRRAWEALFENFFQHILRRYGKREVGRWILRFQEIRHMKKAVSIMKSPDIIFFTYTGLCIKQ
ncbi:hypothetical protein C823_003508 [Eubacterium plexicaudatum ASF492]|nr:hypothetical protein C823_003508 [Eubacterium plexicaudatum ASF492]